MSALSRRHAPAELFASGRREAEEGMMGALVRMAEAVGAPPTRLMADFAALSFGPGRIAFSDYEGLRLYDEDFWAGEDRRWVAGARRAREIALQVNFRHDWFGMTENRLAFGAYLAAHGLPTVPLEAVYCSGLATPSANVLRTRDELRRFLESRRGEPLVGVPAEGGRRRMVLGDERSGSFEVDRLIEDICENHADGYLFQPDIAPDEATAALSAGRLAPVRFITIASESGPKVLRAFWRPPGRASLVAQLDLRTGEVLRLMTGDGRGLRDPSGVEGFRVGAVVPHWETLKAAVTEGARLMKRLGLLGWDVAASAEGPVILEVTPTPELGACQLVDRRGFLDPPFLAFIEERRRLAAEHAAMAKLQGGYL
jgi:hypothetical protein